MRLAVLVACYNRVHITLPNLRKLHELLTRTPDLDARVYLLDDASPDRTGDSVKAALPDVTVVVGTGNLFWNRGMCRAYAAARPEGPYDAYLLFNDDVKIFPEKVAAFLSEFSPDTVLVGATVSSADGSTTYSGMRSLSKYRPLAFQKVEPDGRLQSCDAFNGNCVLVPGAFFDEIGGLDPSYLHGFGDIDLGLTARKKGVAVNLWRYPIGECDLNPPKRPNKASLARRLTDAFSGKQDVLQQMYFLFKHGPKWLFPAYAANVICARLRTVLHV